MTVVNLGLSGTLIISLGGSILYFLLGIMILQNLKLWPWKHKSPKQGPGVQDTATPLVPSICLLADGTWHREWLLIPHIDCIWEETVPQLYNVFSSS